MNKGLFAHIIGVIIYVMMVLYVFNGEIITKHDRIGTMVFFVISQIIVFCMSMVTEWYDKKI